MLAATVGRSDGKLRSAGICEIELDWQTRVTEKGREGQLQGPHRQGI